ncbi:MAG: hypothetical protein EOO61_10865 [Hymenobacter sp.]|nr:MAG: hypothetical protein EOO61_10865 [Hymenobacter sp.]
MLLHEKGFNYSQIAERLNALRFLTRTGKAFRAEQVKRLYLRATAQPEPAPDQPEQVVACLY